MFDPALSNEDYHQHPAVSKSQLDRASKGFIHWKRPAQIQTPALAFGSAFHAAVLEPHKFAAEFAVAPEGIDRRTKAGKEQWNFFLEESEGKEVITSADGELIRAMKASVMDHPLANQILTLDGHAEASYFWTDQDTGLECKIRPDYVTAHHMLVDLKTTQDASPEGFARSCAKFRYHVQAAWYSLGYQQVTGEAPSTFAFIAVEKTEPHAVGVYVLDTAALEQGARLAKSNLEKIATWMQLTPEDQEQKLKSGYSERFEILELPQWAFYEED